MGISTIATPSDGLTQAVGNLFNLDFLNGACRIAIANFFGDPSDHILDKNTAHGTIVLVPGFGCNPATLIILFKYLQKHLGGHFNIIFAKPNTSGGINHINDTNSLGTKLLSNLQDIHSEHEVNGNMIVIAHSLGGPLTIQAVLASKDQKSNKNTSGNPLPDNMNIHMIASPLGVVPAAKYPLRLLFPVLEELRKSKLFTDEEFAQFIKSIGGLDIHVPKKDSLVPHESQMMDQYGLSSNLRKKVKHIIYPHDNHCTLINGKGVDSLAAIIAGRIHNIAPTPLFH